MIEKLIIHRKRFSRRVAANFAAIILCYTRLLQAEDETFNSPCGTFIIKQHYEGNWPTTIQFKNHLVADIRLSSDYPWPALFSVSPDEHWILQNQKTGSGDSTAFLYRLDASGRLWRMEQSIGEMAWTYLEQKEHISIADFYHRGIEFVEWLPKAGALRLKLSGSSMKKSGEGIDRQLIYNLEKNTFRTFLKAKENYGTDRVD